MIIYETLLLFILTGFGLTHIVLSNYFDFYTPYFFIEYFIFVLFLFLRKAFFATIAFIVYCLLFIFVYIGHVFNGLKNFGMQDIYASAIDAWHISLPTTLLFTLACFTLYLLLKLSLKSKRKIIFNFLFIPLGMICTTNYLSRDKAIYFFDRDLSDSIINKAIEKHISAEQFHQEEVLFKNYDRNIASKKIKDYSEYKKISLIIVESWPYFNDEKINNSFIEEFLKNKNINVIDYGAIEESESTIKAELRELCETSPSGYGMRSIPEHINCLPKNLRKIGYANFSLHAGGKKFYNRYMWHKSAGFDKSFFYGDLKNKSECFANWRGYCDIDLMDFYFSSLIKEEKNLGYWLTLNSHYPYSKKDLRIAKNYLCDNYSLSNDQAICGNYLLVNEFFENFNLILNKNIKHLDSSIFILVGDHQPYILNKNDKKLLKDGKIPFLIFETIK